MKTLGNMTLVALIAMFVASVAEAQPVQPPPPQQDQAVAPPWDCPNQGVPPGQGPRWGRSTQDGQGRGRMMGAGGRGRGAGLRQGRSGPMAGGQRAFAGARQDQGMQAHEVNVRVAAPRWVVVPVPDAGPAGSKCPRHNAA